MGYAGPLVSRGLGDLGARVIKVESSLKPDISRSRVPPPGMTEEETADVFPQVHEMNAGKNSISLNLKHAEGRRLFVAILERADVYVENFAPGWLERIGLSHEAFLESNPRLIVLAQSPYGSEGPLSQQRAYAPIMTALSGVDGLTGYDAGRNVPQSISNGDLVASYYGLMLVLAALYERRRTGKGAIIDMSQIEASACMAGVAMAEYQLSHHVPVPQGNSDPRYAPHGHFPADGPDRWVALAVWNDDQWDLLCDALRIQKPDWTRFATSAARLADRSGVEEIVAQHTACEERDALCHRLQEVGISCTPVLEFAEVDGFYARMGRPLWKSLTHPRAGEMRITRLPWRFGRRDVAPTRVADRMGESTDELLRDLLGCDEPELEAWRTAGALD